MVTNVIDYLLVTTDPAPPAEDPGVRPAGSEGPVGLTDGVRIERPDEALSSRLLAACELRGERWSPVRQFGVAHAFVRKVPAEAWQRHLYAWDESQALYTALALSRLVRPHASACDYAVRQIVQADGAERLVPYDAEEARVAFRIEDGSRSWLDAGEAEQLRTLLAAYTPDALPARVRRALWLAELMVRERYLEDALPLIVAGLEALLKVGRSRVTAQFAQRTAALGREFLIELDEERCVAAFDDRSGIVHGAHVDLSAPADFDRFVTAGDALQRTLRAAVRTAIADREFAGVFASDEAICARWPLRSR